MVSTFPIVSPKDIIAIAAQGGMFILVDDPDRENEGDIVCLAPFITPSIINFMITFCRGLVCLALTPTHCDQLKLIPQSPDNHSKYNTPFTVSIEAKEGVTTGISAFDRAHTIKVASHPYATSDDIVTPGHIFPLRAHQEGLLKRQGHTEASIYIAQKAGLINPAAVICEILNDDGTMATLAHSLPAFATRHGLPIGLISDLTQK